MRTLSKPDLPWQLRTLALCAITLLSACGGGGSGPDQSPVLSVASSRPDMVSGGDTLVRVTGRQALSSNASIAVNGVVTSAAVQTDAAGNLIVKVAGLSQGENSIELRSGDVALAAVKVTNHPASGPLFSGPHQQPWICQTQDFVLPNGTKLPASTAADCSVPTNVQYVYWNSSGTMMPMPDTSRVPADVMKTTTSDGASVNFIVRVETGTLNRGIYQTAILHDPVSDPAISPAVRPKGWNGRLIYLFGGGCNPGYRQATTAEDSGTRMLSAGGAYQLSQGYALASSSLNVWANNCNSTLSAESMSMVKERFIEQHGLLKATIGLGQSGGAKQQYMIADGYPGLLDALLPGRNANGPDGVTSNLATLDCSLLVNYFNQRATVGWTYEQKTAVAGWSGWNNCEKQGGERAGSSHWHNLFSPNYVLATAHQPVQPIGCSAVIPDSMIYHPVNNPRGLRCDIYTNLINILGESTTVPGAARRPLDNVGTQYGLAAFNSGQITAEQFVDLNERVGGYDADGGFAAARMAADDEALRISYQTGLVFNGAGLNDIPIINWTFYTEKTPDVHDRFAAFMTKERLRRANGDTDNLVMYTYDAAAMSGPFGSDVVLNEALGQLTEWLDRITADSSAASKAVKVRKNKPAGLADACWTSSLQKIVEPAELGVASTCNSLYPAHANPRIVAGMARQMDTVKCQLKPIAAADYPRGLTSAQLERLRAAHPGGVCDYSKPGAQQQKPSGVWFSYPTRGNPVALGIK